MIKSPPLFSGEEVALGSCALTVLGKGEAKSLSRSLILMEPWLTLGYRSETLFNYLVCHDPGLYRYAVLVSGELAGTLCVRFPWFLGPYIEMIAICPPCQGRNIGRDILTWVESRAAHSSRNLWAAVSSFNSKARLFYRSQGFDEVAVLDDLVKKGSAELLLRKRLTPLVGYPVMSSGTDAVVE